MTTKLERGICSGSLQALLRTYFSRAQAGYEFRILTANFEVLDLFDGNIKLFKVDCDLNLEETEC